MSCYNANCTSDQDADKPATRLSRCSVPEPMADGQTGALLRFGQRLLFITQRRQAGRVRLGRLLDAGWSGASKSAANPARSEQ